MARHDAERVAGFLAHYPLLWPDENCLSAYARLYAALRRHRHIVGANDLWIAALAVSRDIPLLSRNVKKLTRVEGLTVVDYGKT